MSFCHIFLFMDKKQYVNPDNTRFVLSAFCQYCVRFVRNKKSPDKMNGKNDVLKALCQYFVRHQTQYRQGLQPITDKMTNQSQRFLEKVKGWNQSEVMKF